MNSNIIVEKTANATKWSILTEIFSRLVSPISNMVLARLLTPDAFGIVASITMVISFIEMFADSGFQKFIIQHEFIDKKELDEYTNVAFWTNIFVCLSLWIAIILCRHKIAEFVGSGGYGDVLAIAGLSLPLTALSSLQIARYKKSFDFRALFVFRVISVFIPLLVTLPLAFFTRSYWSIIVGTIVMNFVNSLILTWKSEWKPRLYFCITQLKLIFNYSWWILVESISVWLTSYVGTFIVGVYLSSYYLGLYKTAMITTNQIMNIIVASTSAPLFSALSKLQKKEDEFRSVYLNYIKAVAFFVVPLGVGIFIFRRFITLVLLGEQWLEVADFIGLWGLTSTICLVLGTYCSGVYNAKGKPEYSFVVQLIHLIFLVPVIYYSVQVGFKELYISRSLVRLQLVAVHLVVMYYFFKFSPRLIIRQCFEPFVGSSIMLLVGIGLLHIMPGYVFHILAIIVCIIVYFLVEFLFFPTITAAAFEILGLKHILSKFSYVR